ncbi:MAG: hypothetical protein A4E73_01619 [Syntrophaceae bacterium PtaU1.Bin231]|nr:MAG: hypothetical protein A4E73_01619 [Syntrophaceae bacterium PtaU1.Bin231]
MPGWRKAKAGFKFTPSRTRKGHCMASCRTPPAMTPTASAVMGSRKKSRSESAAMIMQRFRTTGDSAGAAK